jgi:hypothetical protein
MRRRSLLRLASGLLGTAGYVGTTDDSAPAIERVETPRFVVRLNDLGGDPDGRVTPVGDLSERERGVFRTAVAGTYRTQNRPDWLVRFASATPMVEREGTYYRLEHTFPTYRVTAEAVQPSDVAGRIASYDEYAAAVSRDDYALHSLLRVARRGGVELTYVWPDLRAFFERYDAVRYRGEVVALSVSVEDSGPPYELSAEQVPLSAVARESVWNADEARKTVRALVRRAGRAQGAYGFDRAPADLLDRLRANEYVHLDGTFYAASVEKRGPTPVSVTATVRDGRVHLALRNDGDDDLRVSSGPPRPFGVVRCHPSGDEETTRLLWTDAYAASGRVRTAGRAVRRVEDVALVSTVAPGEAIRERYAVPASLSPGEYVVEDSLGVESEGDDDGETSTVQYRVTFSVS